MASARVPDRTCAGCGRKAPKASLVRVVRVPGQDRAEVDPVGSAPGRGVYLHADEACLEKAVRRDAFARSLRTGVALEEVGRLRSLIEGGT